MDLSLEDRSALVTGSSAGVGAAIASALAREGCRVLVHGRDRERAEAVAGDIRASGGRAEVVIGDLDTAAGLDAVVTAAEAAGVEILVANVGPFTEGTWDDVAVDVWQSVLGSNVTSCAVLIGRLLPVLGLRGWGRVVTVGTRATATPLPNMVAYSAAKAAVVNMTRSLAAHLSGSGVTANCVSPGVVLTPSLEQMFLARPENEGRSWSEVERSVTAEYAPNPAGRLARPDDVADVVTFVCSPRADYVNGAEIRVDGGITSTA